MPRYEFNIGSFLFHKPHHRFWWYVGTVFKYLALSVSVAIVWYVVIALAFTRDSDEKLIRENRMYEKLYPEMVQKKDLVSDVISLLQMKDRRIYKEIFNADAPSMDPLRDLDFFASSDTMPDENYVRYVHEKAARTLERAREVEEKFRKVTLLCEAAPDSLPPLKAPLASMSYAQVGAGTGERMNPFYKVKMPHDGVDLIAPQGDDVLCVGEGVVTGVVLSRKGLGNVVEITHHGGYVSRYCHLSDISVRKGQRVHSGTPIAKVGVSGALFAPHLHFELRKNGVPVDPVNYFIASVTPDEYANMLYMSAHTGQSLD